MRFKNGFLIVLGFLLVYGCNNDPLIKEYPEKLCVQVNNANGPNRSDEIAMLRIEDIKIKYPDFNPMSFVVIDEGKEIPSQINDLNADHQADQIVFICNLSAGQSKKITLRYSQDDTKPHEYTKRTQAEVSHKVGGKFVDRKYKGGEFQNVEYLEVPPENTDHSWFIRYEGPGWESDKVGYRFYLDWRDATDIFGKKTHEMVLQDVGQDGFDSYHEMSDWGMDILKVGGSFGIGTWGMWADGKAHRVAETDKVECEIKINGPIQSMIATNYYGWKISGNEYDLKSTLKINAGSRLTHCNLEISGEPENLCTGIVKHDSTNIYESSEKEKGWQYFATYGKQSLANDMLGMAIFYKSSNLIKVIEDELSHLILLKPQNGKIEYYFSAAWEKELNGITNEDQYVDYLKNTLMKLDTPVKITIE